MHIVLAVKPDSDEPWIIDAVVGLARQTGASVAVVAADTVELERLEATPRSVFTQAAERTATAAARRLTDAGIEATATVRPGRPLPGILDFATEQGADLIVAGASHRPVVAERLLGSVPLDLIKQSSRPVVVITKPS